MLADVLPMMTETVEHALSTQRSIIGKPISTETTAHRARVILTPGHVAGAASQEDMPDAAATVWLANHPRPIRIGDQFTLPDDSTLKAVRVEHRTMGDGTLTKVFLS